MNKINIAAVTIFVSCTFSANSADLLDELKACKSLSDNTERLQCFDKIKLPEEIVLPKVQKAEPEQTFGLKQVVINEEPDVITLEVVKVKKNPYGKLTVYLEQGQVWKQVNSDSLRLKPKDKIEIRKASLGSYLMAKPGSAKLMRVKRIK